MVKKPIRFHLFVRTLFFLGIMAALVTPMQFSRAANAMLTTTHVVTSVSADWAFLNDNGTIGDWSTGFQAGPATAPAGLGSIFINLNSAAAGIVFGTQKYQGTRLADIQSLSYSTYTNLSPIAMSFQINYDPDLNTVESTWFGRLIYEPSRNGTVVNGTWQTWDMLNGGAGVWWASPNGASPVDNTCSQASPCTLTALLTAFPNIGIRNDANSFIQVKAGSNWNGFSGNADNLSIQIAGNTDIYDFEPISTQTTITSDAPDPSNIGQTVSVSVTVATLTVGGPTPPTGTVTISTPAETDCVITLVAGAGSCDITFSSSGSKTITATYNPGAGFGTSLDTESHTVNSPTSTATVTIPVPTNTATSTDTVTPLIPTATATSTDTVTPLIPTGTATSTDTVTPLIPTGTPTSTDTVTPLIPTGTATNTATVTSPIPTGTATNTATVKSPILTGTATRTHTVTPPILTRTATRTKTVTPTVTHTKTPSALTVTINQATGQVDPTTVSPIHFTVVFSEPVSGFTGADLSFAGTTLTGTLSATISQISPMNGTRYDVAVKGMIPKGTVFVNIPAGKASSVAQPSVTNAASTSTDNRVTFDYVLVEFTSTAANDGWLLESTETSGVGGSMNSAASTLAVGDDAADRQYRSLVNFDTASLPDNAVIYAVNLRMIQASVSGTNPFTTHGLLRSEVKPGFFGPSAALELSDFESVPGKLACDFEAVPEILEAIGTAYRCVVLDTAFPYISRINSTQLRLRFTTDDNDDLSADIFNFYSGNYTFTNQRPRLFIKYYIPPVP